MRRLLFDISRVAGLVLASSFWAAGAWSSDQGSEVKPRQMSKALRDSIVVDGVRWQVVADVQIDTTVWQTTPENVDWWFGVGWDIQAAPLATSGTHISTLDLLPNRPSLRLERQQVLRQGRGRWGCFAEHSQPWTFSAGDVSEFAKGWIWEGGSDPSSPVRQVVLTPDSLAFERDTAIAPLTPGHALRLGVNWEGNPLGGWRPRLAVSGFAWRPFGWSLHAPSDPALWMNVESADTFEREAMWRARMRLEAGLVLDLGESHPGARAAAQFRADAFWLPGSVWGFGVSFLVSPTRR